jgi:hypothetical protein
MPNERVDLAAVDLFASISRPLVSGLKARGNIPPAPPSEVFEDLQFCFFGETESCENCRIDLSWSAQAF